MFHRAAAAYHGVIPSGCRSSRFWLLFWLPARRVFRRSQGAVASGLFRPAVGPRRNHWAKALRALGLALAGGSQQRNSSLPDKPGRSVRSLSQQLPPLVGHNSAMAAFRPFQADPSICSGSRRSHLVRAFSSGQWRRSIWPGAIVAFGSAKSAGYAWRAGV